MAERNKKKITYKDPARYPLVIEPLENKEKVMFNRTMKRMTAELTSEMVKLISK